jgi:hypothetical protein
MGDCTNEAFVVREQIPDGDFSDLFAFAPERQQREVIGEVDRNQVQTVVLCDQMLAIIGDEHGAMPIWKRPEHLLQSNILDACAGVRVRSGADAPARTSRCDLARRRQRHVASGSANCDREDAANERAQRPNETELSYRWRERAQLRSTTLSLN